MVRVRVCVCAYVYIWYAYTRPASVQVNTWNWVHMHVLLTLRADTGALYTILHMLYTMSCICKWDSTHTRVIVRNDRKNLMLKKTNCRQI